MINYEVIREGVRKEDVLEEGVVVVYRNEREVEWIVERGEVFTGEEVWGSEGDVLGISVSVDVYGDGVLEIGLKGEFEENTPLFWVGRRERERLNGKIYGNVVCGRIRETGSYKGVKFWEGERDYALGRVWELKGKVYVPEGLDIFVFRFVKVKNGKVFFVRESDLKE